MIDAGVFFGHGTDNAWDEAVQLVLAVAGLPLDSGDEVLSVSIDAQAQARLGTLLQQRIELRRPLPYLLGRAWYAGLEFIADERALVPRSPLAELILSDFLPWYTGPGPKRLLDLCCGGGSIGLSAAYYHPELEVDLADLDTEALALALENTAFHQLQGRCNVLQSDLFEQLAGRRYDIILSNPPYVDAQDIAAMPREYLSEPEIALGSGADGLDITRRILCCAEDFLEPEGLLVVEVGNSWEALEASYPTVPFTWLEFEQGGHGVFTLSAKELKSYRESLGA